MTDPTPQPSRRFSEKEVAQIIKRASELQEYEAPAESTTGMSLAELEQVAREAGLDPAMVRRAATDLDTRVTDEPPSRFIGAPTTLRLERTIEGEIPADEYEPIVLEIQRMLGGVGTASTLGRTLQWSMTTMDRRRGGARLVQVTITPRHGRTTIRIEEPLSGVVGGLFGGLMAGLGGGLMGPVVALGIGALHSALATIGLVGGVVSGAYLLARTLYGRVVVRRGDRLQALMSQLVEHATRTALITPGTPRPAENRALERGG